MAGIDQGTMSAQGYGWTYKYHISLVPDTHVLLETHITLTGDWTPSRRDYWEQGIEKVWSGGDTLRLGLATISIGQGRRAAECIHAQLRGEEPKEAPTLPPVGPDRLKLDWYPAKERAERRILPPEERLANPSDEVDLGISPEQALEETTRCFSCGQCFGCENCWMYCQNTCFKKQPEVKKLWDKIKLKLPVLGDMTFLVALEKISSIMYILLDSGLPLVYTLEAVAKSSGNCVSSIMSVSLISISFWLMEIGKVLTSPETTYSP